MEAVLETTTLFAPGRPEDIDQLVEGLNDVAVAGIRSVPLSAIGRLEMDRALPAACAS